MSRCDCGRVKVAPAKRCLVCAEIAKRAKVANRRRAKVCRDLSCGRCTECRRLSRPNAEVA